MTLFRPSSSVTSKTIYQKRSEHPNDSRFERSHPLDLLVRKTLHRVSSTCGRIDLAPGGSKLLASFGLCQSVAFCIGQEAYSANPIPPFEHPVTTTTFDSPPADILFCNG